MALVVELCEASQGAQHGADVEGQLIHVHAAIDKIMEEEVGQVGNDHGIHQGAQGALTAIVVLLTDGQGQQYHSTEDQHQVCDVRNGECGDTHAGAKEGICKYFEQKVSHVSFSSL